jgi:uncharacterized protein YrrD
MAELSDFRLGSNVLGQDGEMAGTLVSVLVDGEGLDPKAIVVRDETTLVGRMVAEEKYLITDEVVIPLSLVESATHDRVQLSIPAAHVRGQPPYLSYRLKPLTSGQALLEEAQLLGGGLALPPEDEIANKPAGEIEIDRDENVMLGQTGHRLGHVQDVLYDAGELVGIVIRPEGMFKHDVVLPIRFISRADDMALFADIGESDLAKLSPPPFKGEG